jgi:hypothetical protein
MLPLCPFLFAGREGDLVMDLFLKVSIELQVDIMAVGL